MKYGLKHASIRYNNRKFNENSLDAGFIYNMLMLGNYYECLTILAEHGYAPTLRKDLPEGTLPDSPEIIEYFQNPSLQTFKALRLYLNDRVDPIWRKEINRKFGSDNKWDLFACTKKQTVFSQLDVTETTLVLLLIYTLDKIMKMHKLEDRYPNIAKDGVSWEELKECGLWNWGNIVFNGKTPKKRKRNGLTYQRVSPGGEIDVDNFCDVDDLKTYIHVGSSSCHTLSGVASAMFMHIDQAKDAGAKKDAKLVLEPGTGLNETRKTLKEKARGGVKEKQKSGESKRRRGKSSDSTKSGKSKKARGQPGDSTITGGSIMTGVTEASRERAKKIIEDPSKEDRLQDVLATILDGDYPDLARLLTDESQEDNDGDTPGDNDEEEE